MVDFFEQTEKLIGKIITDIIYIWISFEDDSSANDLIGMLFHFKDQRVLFRANGDFDIIDMDFLDENTHWKERYEFEETLGIVSCRDSLIKDGFVGKKVWYIWKCENTEGFIDSIDFAIGDLVFPNLKLYCAASTLYVFSISEMGYSHFNKFKKAQPDS